MQAADNSVFLRNDNSWQPVTPENIGAATEEQGQKADYALQGIQVNGVHVSPDLNRYVNVTIEDAVDIHNNVGGGDGFECFYHHNGGTGKTLAQNIEAEVKAIGQNSRGCKIRLNSGGTDYYGFIRETACPAVIVEGCFVDNATDVQIADSIEEQKAFGVAYAKGSREPRHASRATFSFLNT